MSIATAPALTSSMTTVMDNLVALEKVVHPDLRVYRWRPRNPDLPAIWNVLTDGSTEQRDQMRWRDNLGITVQLGIIHTDHEEDYERLEMYIESFRALIDDALYARRPLGGQFARRTSMRMVQLVFGGGAEAVSVLGVEFPILVQIDRKIEPN